MEDPGWALFTCKFFEELSEYVHLPKIGHTHTIFDENYHQIFPLQLKDKNFRIKLEKAVDEAEKSIQAERNRGRMSKDEKLYN